MKKFLIVLGAGCLAVSGAVAADTVYSSRSAFDAAAGALTTITFDGIAGPGSFVDYGGGPLTLSGVTFTSNATSYPYGGFLNADYAGLDTITAALPATTALGFDIGGLFGAQTFTIGTSDGGSFVVNAPDSIIGTSALDFFGVTTSTPITSITVSYTDGAYGALDNFSFGAVPEPATWGLMILGFGGIGGVLRRAARTPASPRLV
jgi:hypothetical protein